MYIRGKLKINKKNKYVGPSNINELAKRDQYGEPHKICHYTSGINELTGKTKKEIKIQKKYERERRRMIEKIVMLVRIEWTASAKQGAKMA